MTATRRALILGLVLAILCAGTVGLMLGRQTPMSSAPEAAPVRVVASPGTVPSSGAPASPTVFEPEVPAGSTSHSDDDEAKAHWEPAVEGFARNFTKTRGGQRAWSNRLEPFVTEEVGRYLATVDIANVPTGRYGECEVVQDGEMRMAVQVTYREGWSMVLYLISDGTKWRVARYDRFEE